MSQLPCLHNFSQRSPGAGAGDGLASNAGKPETVHGRLKTLEPVEESPLGAVVEATGMKTASTSAMRAHISRWKRIRCRRCSAYSWPRIALPFSRRVRSFGGY